MREFLPAPALQRIFQPDLLCQFPTQEQDFSDQTHDFGFCKEYMFGTHKQFLPLEKTVDNGLISLPLVSDTTRLFYQIITKFEEQPFYLFITQGKADCIVFFILILVYINSRCARHFSCCEPCPEFNGFAPFFVQTNVQFQRMLIVHSRKISGSQKSRKTFLHDTCHYSSLPSARISSISSRSNQL